MTSLGTFMPSRLRPFCDSQMESGPAVIICSPSPGPQVTQLGGMLGARLFWGDSQVEQSGI